MPTLEQKLLQNVLDIESFSRGVGKDIVGLLREAEQAGIEQLAALNPNTLYTTRFRLGTLQEINGTLNKIQDPELQLLRAAQKEVGGLAHVSLANALNTELGLDAAEAIPTRLPTNQLNALLTKPIGGRPLEKWIVNQSGNFLGTARKELGQSIILGETVGQASRRLSRTLDGFSRNSADVLARTTLLQTANDARDVLYANNADVLVGFQYVATLDIRVCPICAKDDLRTAEKRENLPSLPRHPRCRCTIVPVTPISEDEVMRPAVTEQEASTVKHRDGGTSTKWKIKSAKSTSQRFQDFFEGQPASWQRDWLGPKRFELWKQGSLKDLGDLAANRRILTLPELQKRLLKTAPALSSKSVDIAADIASLKAKGAPKLLNVGNNAAVDAAERATKETTALASAAREAKKAMDLLAQEIAEDTARRAAQRAAIDPGIQKGILQGQNWTRVAAKPGGSLPGATMQAPDGTQFIVKFPRAGGSVNQLVEELAANRLYRRAGVNVPELFLVDDVPGFPGQRGLASKVLPDAEDLTLKALQASDDVQQAFVTDAWLANWDVAGLSLDNIVLSGGRAFRIDVGGALRFRAQGAPKGTLFGKKVREIKTLRDASFNPSSAKVFRELTDEQLIVQMKALTSTMTDEVIREILESVDGLIDVDELLEILIARRLDLIAQTASLEAQLAKKLADSIVIKNVPGPASRVRIPAALLGHTATKRGTLDQLIDYLKSSPSTGRKKVLNHMVLRSESANDIVERRALFRAWIGKAAESLSDSDVDRIMENIRDFTGSTYTAIRAVQRGGVKELAKVLGSTARAKASAARFRQAGKDLEFVVREGPRFSRKGELFRGMGFSSSGDEREAWERFKDLVPGDVFNVGKGTSSFSTSFSTAEFFAQTGPLEVVLKVQHGLRSATSVKWLSDIRGEDEVLASALTNMRVLSKTIEGNRVTLIVEQLALRS